MGVALNFQTYSISIVWIAPFINAGNNAKHWRCVVSTSVNNNAPPMMFLFDFVDETDSSKMC